MFRENQTGPPDPRGPKRPLTSPICPWLYSLNRVLSYDTFKYVNIQMRFELKGRFSYRNFSTVIDYFALEDDGETLKIWIQIWCDVEISFETVDRQKSWFVLLIISFSRLTIAIFRAIIERSINLLCYFLLTESHLRLWMS